MPKASAKPKLFKSVKKVINDQEFICVRYRNIDKKDLRELKSAFDTLCKEFLTPVDTDEV